MLTVLDRAVDHRIVKVLVLEIGGVEISYGQRVNVNLVSCVHILSGSNNF